MRKQSYQWKSLSLIALLLLSGIAAFAAENTAAPAKDPLLELLPSDCPICVRINGFQTALGQLDQYLAGSSPMPISLSILATGYVAGIFGDPMMTGLDMQGSIAMVAMQTNPSNKSLFLSFLVPTTTTVEFLKANKNLSSPDADGIYTLQVENSPVGNLILYPMADKKYLLITREENKDDLLKASKLIKEKKTALASRFNADQAKSSQSQPAWAYVNIDKVYTLYKDYIDRGIQEVQVSVAEQAGGEAGSAMQPKLQALFEMLQYFAGQADWMTLSLTPSPKTLQAETVFSAKAGSELAGMLKPAAPAGTPWQTAGYLNGPGAVKYLMRFNKPMWEQMSIRMIDMFAKNAPEQEKAQLEKMKSLMHKWFAAYGSEAAGTFSYRSGTPPFEFNQIIQIIDAKAINELQKETIEPINSLYASMDLGMDFSYAASVEKYKGTDIGLYQIKFKAEDPTSSIIESMYGKQGLQYPLATTSDRFLMTLGPDAMNQIKAMIDNPKAGPATGEIKTALDTIADSGKAEFVMSANVLSLMKGVTDMARQVTAGSGTEMPDFWQGISTKTTSNLSAAGFIEPGRIRGVMILPKEHLSEVVQAFMQIQQKQMEFYMQQSQQDGQGLPFGGQEEAEEEYEDPMLKTIGTAIPEMKMKDLAGKEITLSGLKGKPIILDFWATWCPPCKEMIPQIVELRKQHQPDKLAIIGISNESVDKLKPFAEKYSINYQIVSYSNDLPAPFDAITSIPTMLFIDSEGVIRDVRIGTHAPEDVNESLRKIMKP
ncbi:MAG: TlpA family protein disulfide reductase [Sedimentisphaerales bacterium]|nr:TlpA family protein disulfide reductase [Sedimentisphaerales bacterium]